MNIDPILIAMAVSLGIALLCLSFAFDGGKSRQAKRVARLKERGQAPTIAALQLRRDQGDRRKLDQFVRRYLPRPDLLRQRLKRTGRSISLGGYALTCLGVAVISGGAFAVLGSFSLLLALPVGLLLGLWLPHFTVGRLGARRANKFTALFSDAIGLMVRGLKSGLPITETFQIVANEVPDPVGAEFRLVSDQIRLGHPVEQALLDAAHRVGTPELKFLVVTLSIQRETGGNLAETLENLDMIIRKRRQMKLKIKAMSSEAKASAMIVGSLPFIMLAMLSIMNKPYISVLFTDPRGHMILAGAATSMTFGIGVMAKLARFEI